MNAGRVTTSKCGEPAGAFDRQLTLTVADLMVPAPELEPLEPTAPLPEVITHLTQGSPRRGSLQG